MKASAWSCTLVALAAVVSVQAEPIPTVIYSEIATSPTSQVPGLDPGVLFDALERPFGSPDGLNWIIQASSSLATSEDEVIIVGGDMSGTVVAREGTATPFNEAINFGTFDQGMGINNVGEYAFNADTTAATSEDEHLIKFSGGVFSVIAQEGQPAPPFDGGTWGSTLGTAHIVADGRVGFEADSIDGPPSGQDNAVLLADEIRAQAGVDIPPGQIVIGAVETWENFDLSDYHHDATGANWLALGDMTGSTSRDDVLVVNGTVVLQEDIVIPGSGYTSPIGSSGISTPTMAPNGDWYVYGDNDDGQEWVLKNGSVISQSGDPIVTGDSELFTSYFLAVGNGNGDFCIGGETDAADPDANEVLAVNNTTVVARTSDGVDVDGNGIADDDAFIDDFDIDDAFLTDTGWLYFTADLRDGGGVISGQAFMRIDTAGEGPSVVQVIYSEIDGDPTAQVPGLDPGVEFDLFDRPYCSPDGVNWILSASCNLATSEDEVIVVGSGITGTVVIREGTPAPWDGAINVGLIDQQMGINDNGDFAFQCDTNADTSADEHLIKFTNGESGGAFTVVAREGDAIPSIEGATWGSTLTNAHLVNVGTVAFEADSISGLPSGGDNALFIGTLIRGENGGDPLPGQDEGGNEPWENFDLDDFQHDATGDNWLAEGDLTGNTSFDDVLVVNGTLVLQEGVIIAGSDFVSPVGLNGIVQPFMASNGDWYCRGDNDDDQDWVVKNGAVVVRTGDPITPGNDENFSDGPFAACFFINTGNGLGDYVIGGTTNAADEEADAVLVLNGETVIGRQGDPVDVDGNGLFDDNAFIDIFNNDDCFLTNDLKFYFTAELYDDTLTSLGQAYMVMDLAAQNEPPFIVHANALDGGETNPCTGYVDPRAESDNGELQNLGITELNILFSEEVFGVGGGALAPEDFIVSETGIGFNIDESQEPGGGTGSEATGIGNVSLNEDQTQLTIHVEHTLDTVTAGHIHNAPSGQNGPVAFGFADPTSPIDAVWNLSPSDVDELMAGNLYVNLHSAAFPGGEIRGQIVPNGVVAVDGTNNPLVTVTLNRVISLEEWTTVQAVVEDNEGAGIINEGDLGPGVTEPDRVDVGNLPCDVDQTGDCSPFDLLEFRQLVNEQIEPGCGGLLNYVDIDRNGDAQPFDLLTFRQLVNGVGNATQSWSGAAINNPQP